MHVHIFITLTSFQRQAPWKFQYTVPKLLLKQDVGHIIFRSAQCSYPVSVYFITATTIGGALYLLYILKHNKVHFLSCIYASCKYLQTKFCESLLSVGF